MHVRDALRELGPLAPTAVDALARPAIRLVEAVRRVAATGGEARLPALLSGHPAPSADALYASVRSLCSSQT